MNLHSKVRSWESPRGGRRRGRRGPVSKRTDSLTAKPESYTWLQICRRRAPVAHRAQCGVRSTRRAPGQGVSERRQMSRKDGKGARVRGRQVCDACAQTQTTPTAARRCGVTQTHHLIATEGRDG